MKLRNGYVSNSSSSSYIISFKSTNDCVDFRGINITVQDLFDQINAYCAGDENYLGAITDGEYERVELIDSINGRIGRCYSTDIQKSLEDIREQVQNNYELNFAIF